MQAAVVAGLVAAVDPIAHAVEQSAFGKRVRRIGQRRAVAESGDSRDQGIGHVFQCFLDVDRAGVAGHAGDLQLCHEVIPFNSLWRKPVSRVSRAVRSRQDRSGGWPEIPNPRPKRRPSRRSPYRPGAASKRCQAARPRPR
ncbi:hypothetical protein G6F59_017501 [Rhizopus arrhizus]|nr:hypothetical protein G6F59_017501 [Rhizopus arrhizus]